MLQPGEHITKEQLTYSYLYLLVILLKHHCSQFLHLKSQVLTTLLSAGWDFTATEYTSSVLPATIRITHHGEHTPILTHHWTSSIMGNKLSSVILPVEWPILFRLSCHIWFDGTSRDVWYNVR